MEQITCQDCAKKWEREKKRGRKPKRCEDCRADCKAKREAAYRAANPKSLDRSCAGCGSAMTTQEKRRRGHRRHYCHACIPSGRLAPRADDGSERNRITCRDCGKKLTGKQRVTCPSCAGYKKAVLLPRTCVVCDRSFTPNVKGQATCPPSEDERAGGKVASWCAATLDRYKSGQRRELKGTPPPFDGKKYVRKFDCAHCGKPTIPGENGTHIFATRFCSSNCKSHHHKPKRGPTCRITKRETRTWIEGRCPECGDRFVRKDNHHLALGYCSTKCQKRVSRRRRRAYKKGAGYKTLTYWSIAERDNWTCQLCGKPIDTDAVVPHPNSPTLDHIVPLSRGGDHSIENSQLAHFICNSTKSDGLAVSVGKQMSLV